MSRAEAGVRYPRPFIERLRLGEQEASWTRGPASWRAHQELAREGEGRSKVANEGDRAAEDFIRGAFARQGPCARCQEGPTRGGLGRGLEWRVERRYGVGARH